MSKTKTQVAETSVDPMQAMMANPMMQMMAGMAALAGGMPVVGTPTSVKTTGKKEKKERDPYYVDVEGSESVLAGEAPQSLLDDLRATQDDKTLGSSQKARLIASIKADIAAATHGPEIVLQHGTPRLLKEYPNTRDTNRVQILIPVAGEEKPLKVEMKTELLRPFLQHAARVAQWLDEQEAAGRLD